MAGGNAVPVQQGGGEPEHPLDFLRIGNRHALHDEIQRVLEELAEQLAILVERELSAFGLRRAAVDAEHLERFGIHDADVPARPGDADRIHGRDAVEIPARREAALIPEIVVVEAAPQHPRAFWRICLGNVIAEVIEHTREGIGVR